MARNLTGDKMIDSVRNRTMAPDDTSIFTDDDILDILDEELNVQVLDKLISLHGENIIVTVDIPRNDKGHYNIPYRAVGNKLRDISMKTGERVYELAQLSIGELPDYTVGESYVGDLDKFYIEDNKVKIVQPSRQYDIIRMRYYLRPSYLTKVEEAGVISDIINDDIAGTTTLILSSVGKNFNSTSKFDIVGYRSPNKIQAFDLDADSYATSGNTGTIVFQTEDLEDVLDDIQKGDYVSLAEQTPMPNLPTEMHPLLAQAAAVNILESMTDTEALNNAKSRMEKMVTAVQVLIDSRVELAPKKIKPRHGTLQSGLGRNGRGRY